MIPWSKLNQVLTSTHNHPLGGHTEMKSVFNRLTEKYWWPGIFEDIRSHILAYDTCQRRTKKQETEKLESITPPTAFDYIGIDIIRPLLETTRGNKYIVVIIDYLTK